MTGVIKSTFNSNTWINGVTNAVVKGEYTNYGAILSMPVKDGRVSISSYPSNDNYIYFDKFEKIEDLVQATGIPFEKYTGREALPAEDVDNLVAVVAVVALPYRAP